MKSNFNELCELQGLLVRGYGHLPHAAFFVLQITEGVVAKPCLKQWSEAVTRGDQKPAESALNMAFTHSGLVALGLSAEALASFSDTFRAGMVTPHKQRILGDVGTSAPEHWQWGIPEQTHVLIVLYDKTQAGLQQRIDQVNAEVAECSGLVMQYQLDSELLPDHKEHFGFRDGIAQPYIQAFDSRKTLAEHNPVPLGEFVLGYSNGYQLQTRSPMVRSLEDTQGVLSASATKPNYHDLGRNGSYLVVRQLQQDVPGFWQAMQTLSQQVQGMDPVRLASKMVGRWPNGVPLVMAPDKEPEVPPEQLDNFLYHHEDERGLKCPLGAHIRRTHPRDSLNPDPGSQKSIEFSNRHRLLRRGRPYGQPFDESLSPKRYLEKIAAGQTDGQTDEARGLMFMAFNANIERQFEFVQHTWSNNPNFNGLYQDPDPITGTRGVAQQRQAGMEDQFTMPVTAQGCPMNQRVSGLPEFIKMVGGGYFFMPSLSVLKFLLMS